MSEKLLLNYSLKIICSLGAVLFAVNKTLGMGLS